MNDEKKSIGIWLRVSTEDQVKGESPQHHEARARAYALSKGWNVATVYDLGGFSGKSVTDHPECKRMMADVESGRISALVFSQLARLARNTRELLDFADFFKAQEADLVSLQESIDTSSPSGRLFYTLIAAMAQWERELIASRVAASIPIRAKLGKPLGGAAPFGYRWHERKLVVDNQEAPVRKLIYDLFMECRRVGTVARLLNERGYRTRKGLLWTDTSVARLIQDPTAKGRHRANYTRTDDNTKSWTRKDESDWVWRDVPAIVPVELWEACNSHLLTRRATKELPAKRSRHLFTGLVFCHCGEKMYVPSRSPKYVCYACRNKIPTSDLESVFREQLKGFFLSPDDVRQHLEQADGQLTEKAALLASLNKEQARVLAQMDQILALHLDSQISKTSFAERYGPLEARKEALADEIPRLQGELDFLRISRTSSDELIREAQDLYGNWDRLDPADKRRLVEQLVQRLTIGSGEVSLDLCFRPSPLETMTGSQRDRSASSARRRTPRNWRCSCAPTPRAGSPARSSRWTAAAR